MTSACPVQSQQSRPPAEYCNEPNRLCYVLLRMATYGNQEQLKSRQRGIVGVPCLKVKRTSSVGVQVIEELAQNATETTELKLLTFLPAPHLAIIAYNCFPFLFRHNRQIPKTPQFSLSPPGF